ncbi:Probable anion transporter 5 [Dionaea muscipula]
MEHLIKGKRVNLPELMIQHMFHAVSRINHDLPYGMSISKVLNHFRVPLCDILQEKNSEMDHFRTTFLKKVELECHEGVWWLGKGATRRRDPVMDAEPVPVEMNEEPAPIESRVDPLVTEPVDGFAEELGGRASIGPVPTQPGLADLAIHPVQAPLRARGMHIFHQASQIIETVSCWGNETLILIEGKLNNREVSVVEENCKSRRIITRNSVCYIERVGFSIAYTIAADAVGVSQSSKGTVLSTFYYGYACSQVPGGWAAQKIGGRRVLLLSFVLWSLTCALVPLDPNRVMILVIARLLVGVAQGFIFPSIHTVLAQWVPPHERSRSVSLTTSGMYLGAAAGMLLIPSLVKLKGPQFVFVVEAVLGAMWSLLWLTYASDPPRSENSKAAAAGFGDSLLPVKGNQKLRVENGGGLGKTGKIPWKKIFISLPVWAIVVNNFTFHYALYVLMNWLPTYFEQGLQLSLQEMGSSKMMPYLNMFIFSNVGGVIADHLITSKTMNITRTRKLLNTIGFISSSFALMALPIFRTPGGAVVCSSVALGFLALGRAGFAINHMDIAPRYAGIVMGVSNTAGTLAGIVGVEVTGQLLEAARLAGFDISSPESWRAVFAIPGLLCIFSAIVFLIFSTGERIFD